MSALPAVLCEPDRLVSVERKMHLKTLGIREHNQTKWTVEFHPEFAPEVARFPEAVRQMIISRATLLREFGPQLGRPQVDTLKGSKHSNMKELRFRAEDGAWRVAFAFDGRRRAILLVGGDKSGMSQGKFYDDLIEIADHRFDTHQKAVAVEKGKQ
jgi:hypothetical protein